MDIAEFSICDVLAHLDRLLRETKSISQGFNSGRKDFQQVVCVALSQPLQPL